MTSGQISTVRCIILAVLAALFLAPETGAQVVIKRVGKGDSTFRMEKFDASKVVLIHELGAVVSLDGRELRVTRVQPPETRKESYREVDVQAGDLVLLLNGKRVKEIKALRSAYDAVATGSEVKLGLQRGEQFMSAAFPKADPKDLPGVRIIRRGGEGEDRIVPELGAFLDDSPEGPRVRELMMGEARPEKLALAEGDVITALNRKPVKTVNELGGLLKRSKAGEELTLEVRRNGSVQSFTFTKPDVSSRVIIRRD